MSTIFHHCHVNCQRQHSEDFRLLEHKIPVSLGMWGLFIIAFPRVFSANTARLSPLQ